MNMAFKPMISVVVPVYNAEKYIKQCVDSILLQTYENLEIIFVDDGSFDDSLKILKEYENKDKRIKILSQKNLGASSARNKGIVFARGEYISFIDSDDWVSLCLFERFIKAINKIENKIDIYCFNMGTYYETMQENSTGFGSCLDIRLYPNRQDEYKIHNWDDCTSPFRGNLSVCNKIFKTSFLKENNIYMPEGLIFEDQIFAIETMALAKTMLLTNETLYHYRNSNLGSVTKNYGKKIFDIFKILDLIDSIIIKTNRWQSYKYALLQHKYRQLSYLYFQADKYDKKRFYSYAQEYLKTYLKQDFDKNIYKKLSDYAILKDLIEKSESSFQNKYKSIMIQK